MRPLLLAAVLAPSLTAQSITLSPIADATTDSSLPAANFGGAPELNLGKQYSSTPSFHVWFTRAHVQFDTTALVGIGVVPSRATFRWYQSQSSAAGCLDVSVHRVLAPWTEGTITWASQPAHDPAPLSTTCVGSSFDLGWKEFDVTALVQAWLDGTAVDFGFVIRDPSESTAGAARPGLGHSREYGNTQLRPYLEIEFAESFGNTCTTHGTPPVWGVAGGAAIMGETLVFGLSDVLPGSLAVAFFGLDDTQWNGVPLPLSLAALGAPACDLNVSAEVGITLGVLPTGATTLSIVVPTSAAFDGMPLFSQALALTPSAALEASNGLGVTLWTP